MFPGNDLLGWDWLGDRSVSIASGLHSLAVHAWGASSSEAALASLVAAVEVDILEVEGVDVAGDISVDLTSAVVRWRELNCSCCLRNPMEEDNIPKESEADIDQEISSAACDEEDTNGWH